jgi:predicted ABC-type ATPase
MMLQRIHELAAKQVDFAFEITLASRSFVPLLKQFKAEGYQIVLSYFYLENPELAVSRLTERVLAGGHHIPESVIRRRYTRSLENLTTLYLSLADACEIYDNSDKKPQTVAWSLGTPKWYF